MRIAQKLAEVAVIACTVFVLALDGRKFGPQNQQRPKNCDHSNEQIGLDNTQLFRLEISFVKSLRLAGGDLLRAELHSGKNEDRPNERSADGSDGIEGLGKIQTPLRRVRIAQLRNEWVRRRLKK